MRTKAQRRTIKAVAYLQQYMSTYTGQPEYENYRVETLIDDVLYGLGVALDKKYQFHGGFARFKDRLRRHLNKL